MNIRGDENENIVSVSQEESNKMSRSAFFLNLCRDISISDSESKNDLCLLYIGCLP